MVGVVWRGTTRGGVGVGVIDPCGVVGVDAGESVS